jgi:glycosyltransferase involved in cell wall biosynthesis
MGPVVLTVHEPRVQYGITRQGLIMAPLQDAYLQLLLRLAHQVIVPTNRSQYMFRGVQATVIPVGSNLPFDAPVRDGPPSSPLRVGIFSSPGRDHLNALAVEAIRAAADQHAIEAIAIGGGVADGIPSTGYLGEHELALALASRDLLLLPYSDGVTGRRTTFFAALQVGCAVLTTLARPMSDFSIDGSFVYTPPGRSSDFIDAAVRLCGDATRLEDLGRKGRSLYERELAGDVLIHRVINVYEQALR